MQCKYVIDTSSLLILVRYFMTLDEKGMIETCIQQQLDAGALGLLRQVLEQSKRVGQGMILKKIPLLDNEKYIIEVDWDISKRVINKVRDSWCARSVKNKMVSEGEAREYKRREAGFLADADFRLIAYSMKHKSTVVTEETSEGNDGKLFHKIPKICRMEGVECIDIIEYLKRLGIKADFHL